MTPPFLSAGGDASLAEENLELLRELIALKGGHAPALKSRLEQLEERLRRHGH